MGKLTVKVIGYILLRYIIFFGILYSSKTAKMVKWSDLQKGADWFMFFWLFFVPIIGEIVIIGIPMAYDLSKISTSTNKFLLYSILVALFVVEFLIADWLYGIPASYWKLSVSITLFLLFFWRRLF